MRSVKVGISPLLKQAIKALNGRIDIATGLNGPDSKNLAMELFLRLRTAGEALPGEQVKTLAIATGWYPNDAANLSVIAQQIGMGTTPRFDKFAFWPEDIIDTLRERAAQERQ